MPRRGANYSSGTGNDPVKFFSVKTEYINFFIIITVIYMKKTKKLDLTVLEIRSFTCIINKSEEIKAKGGITSSPATRCGPGHCAV